MALPFADAAFDAVVCQFGVMFFPDKAAAFAEARRVLRPGGTLLFNVWDRLEDNDFADTVTAALAGRYSRTIRRASWRARRTATATPAPSRRDLARGGFAARAADRHRGRAAAAPTPPAAPAIAYCQGTPLRGEIEARDALRPGGGDRTGGAGDRAALRAGAGRGRHPGARRHGRPLSGRRCRRRAAMRPLPARAGDRRALAHTRAGDGRLPAPPPLCQHPRA